MSRLFTIPFSISTLPVIVCLSLPGCIEYNLSGSVDDYALGVQCKDEVDNDHDGWVDVEDPDCAARFALAELGYGASVCNDALDNDGDGFADAGDANCLSATDGSEGSGAGDVIITEFLANPAAVTDNNGEWIEFHNTTAKPVDLKGWILQDSVGSHVIGSTVTIPVHGYVVLSKSGSSVNGLPGAYPSAYVYGSGITLSNGGDTITLLDTSGLQVSQVQFSAAQVVEGASLQMDAGDVSAGGLEAVWCGSLVEMNGTGSDKGSPGQVNASCE